VLQPKALYLTSVPSDEVQIAESDRTAWEITKKNVLFVLQHYEELMARGTTLSVPDWLTQGELYCSSAVQRLRPTRQRSVRH